MGKLWGGRFEQAMEAEVETFTQSLSVDARMVEEDLWASEAHALMLARQGILSEDDLRRILEGLERARADYAAGTWELRPELEDVHMNVERYVIDFAGEEYGGKLHTARSRNDQVLADARLYIRRQILLTEERLLALQEALLDLAAAHLETVMPGYTHTQHAQPITLGFWASGHASALARDLGRLAHAYGNVNQNPLGACALAGTSFPIDRQFTAELLGFDGVQEHALDVTSSRDFILEPLSALALLMSHLSRLAEEVVWWSTYEFRFFEVAEAYSSGSSIMPQKKNPDVAELTRGKAGAVFGRLIQVLTLVKGLPMGYSRDLQEDKLPLWEAFDEVQQALSVMAGTVRTLTVYPERLAELAAANFATATELANHLVRAHRLPFRRSHEIVGQVVRTLIAEGRTLTAYGRVCELLGQQGIPETVEGLQALLDPLRCVQAHTSQGGTAPAQVARLIAELRQQAALHRASCRDRQARLQAAWAQTQEQVARVLQRNRGISTELEGCGDSLRLPSG